MSENQFPKELRNRVRQVAKRGHYDRETVYSILDQCLVGQVAFVQDEKPICIPMLFARSGDDLLFHGSSKSRLMLMLCSGQEICVSVTLLDGLVLAKSLFHHSMNYRSATVFGQGRELVDESERLDALQVVSDKVMPGRWQDARPPSTSEMKATCVAALKITSASAKIRTGGPSEEKADEQLAHWSGVIPIHQVAQEPIVDSAVRNDLPIPEYISAFRKQTNS